MQRLAHRFLAPFGCLFLLTASCGDDDDEGSFENTQGGSAGSLRGGSSGDAGSGGTNAGASGGSGGTDANPGGGGQSPGEAGAAGMPMAGSGPSGGESGAAQGGSGGGENVDFEACRATTSQEDCEAAGGTWGPTGNAPTLTCLCPTPDAGEPCTQNSDCEGYCQVDDLSNCANLSEGYCSALAPYIDCYCVFGVGAVCP